MLVSDTLLSEALGTCGSREPAELRAKQKCIADGIVPIDPMVSAAGRTGQALTLELTPSDVGSPGKFEHQPRQPARRSPSSTSS